MSPRPPRALLAGLAALAAIFLLAACGGSGSPSDPAASTEQTQEQEFLQFAKCLREHGINVSTPTGGGPVKVEGQGPGTPQKMEAAQAACRRYAPAEKVKLTPQERVDREEAVQKFAKCLREHGIKVEAKSANGGAAFRIHVGPGEGGPNPESPAFQAAQKACQSLLPKPPGGLKQGPGSATSRGGGPPGAGPKVGFGIGG